MRHMVVTALVSSVPYWHSQTVLLSGDSGIMVGSSQSCNIIADDNQMESRSINIYC